MVSILSFLWKSSWDFYRKFECDSIFSQWKMTFQASDLRGSSFLDLLDDDSCPVKPSFSKGSLWLSQFGHLNSLCSCVTRAITNHAPISEYQLRFFPKENFTCPCRLYSIKTRWHVLYEYWRFNNYWNLRRDSLSHFSLFLQFNPSAFVFM